MSPEKAKTDSTLSLVKGWDAPSEEYIKAHRENRLHKLTTHFWNACNLACPGCFVNKSTDPDDTYTLRRKKRYPDELSLDDQKALFEEARQLGVHTVDIVGAGEPTLDPHFDELVDHAEKLGLHTVVFTHGATKMFQNKERLAQYINKPLSFFIKLWSRQSDLQNRYVQGSVGDYAHARDIALQNLEDLGFMDGEVVNVDGFSRRLTRVGADILVMKRNASEIPNIFRYCRSHNIMPEIKTYIPEGPTRFDHERGTFKNLSDDVQIQLKQDEVLPEDFAQLRTELERIDLEEFGNPHLPYLYPQGHFCTQSMAAVYVTIRGEILSCVGTHHIYDKYEPGKNKLASMLQHRLEKVGLGCAPRVEDAEMRGNFVPADELKILTWGQSTKD